MQFFLGDFQIEENDKKKISFFFYLFIHLFAFFSMLSQSFIAKIHQAVSKKEVVLGTTVALFCCTRSTPLYVMTTFIFHSDGLYILVWHLVYSLDISVQTAL